METSLCAGDVHGRSQLHSQWNYYPISVMLRDGEVEVGGSSELWSAHGRLDQLECEGVAPRPIDAQETRTGPPTAEFITYALQFQPRETC